MRKTLKEIDRELKEIGFDGLTCFVSAYLNHDDVREAYEENHPEMRKKALELVDEGKKP